MTPRENGFFVIWVQRVLHFYALGSLTGKFLSMAMM